MATDRRADVTWKGSLAEGAGTITKTTSGAIGEQPVSWAARSEDVTAGGKTSPEELIAAAHAACFSMALSGALAKAGTPPDELHTSATVTFQPGEGITKIALTVEGSVPGMDDATIARIFDPFFTTRRAQGSTGLGLYIVKGLVEAHGGSVAAASGVGEGTAISVTLPAASRRSLRPCSRS